MMRYILIILIIFTYSCTDEQPNAEPATTGDEHTLVLSQSQIANAGIVADTIRKNRISEVLTVNGLVDVPPQNIVSVSFPMGGYLKSTHLLPGMQVRKGEMIAGIEDQSLIQLQQDYLMAVSRLEFLEKNYNRQKLLNEQQVTADKIFQETESAFQSQKILVGGLAEKLRLININPSKLNAGSISRIVAVYSPINGFVSSVKVNIGKYVNPSDVLFELINPEDIHATLTVFEKDLGKIKPGQKVLVTFVDDPSMSYECEVLLITRNVDENRSGIVHCHFEKRPARLLPGMFLNARIELTDRVVTAVPEEALVRFGNEQYVVEVLQDSIFSLLPIQSGITDKGLTEITAADGRELEGKKIIFKNPYPVLSRMKSSDEE